MKIKRVLAIVLSAMLLLSLAACAGSSNDGAATSGEATASSGGNAEAADTIVIYDGQFAEMQLIHQMVKLLVEDQTDLKVDIKDEMAPVNAFNELTKGNSDMTNSYDGTLLTTFLHLDPSDVPDDMTLYDYANQQASEEYGVHLLGKLGINNTYAVAVPQEIAEEYNLETISDLVPVAGQLVFGAEHDFFTEEGSAKYNPFIEFYGLNFKEAKQIDINLKYSAVESGSIDVTIVYATDGLNRQADLKVLKDDQSYFPEYNGALLVSDDFFDKYMEAAPNLEEVLDQMTGLFTDEIMTDLSYQVDVDGMSVSEVAQAFLEEQGLLSA